MPGFALRQLRKAVATIDPLVAHQINLQLCHAFLKRHLLKGLDLKSITLSQMVIIFLSFLNHSRPSL